MMAIMAVYMYKCANLEHLHVLMYKLGANLSQ
jgi:hypothetical protein